MRAHEQRDDHVGQVARTPSPTDSHRPGTGPLTPQAVLALQRALGNTAVSRLLQRSTVDEVLRAPGKPLGDGIREEMEARLGADFADVRVHNDGASQRSAAEIDARAYTAGNHVVLGSNEVDKHTLAHELTHVIQQRQGPVAGTDRGDGLAISDPADRFERAAEENASRVLAEPVPAQRDVTPGSPGPARPAVQRATDEETPADSNWPGAWAEEIANLARSNHLLGPGNRNIKRLPEAIKNTVLALAAEFVSTLQDPEQPAENAKAKLLEMFDAARTDNDRKQLKNLPGGGGPGALGPSRFPSSTYNDLHELINAKRLWLAGDHSLGPWPFDADAKKPDYVVGEGNADGQTADEFYESTRDVGDHVKVTGKNDLAAVVSDFGKNVKSKISTYDGKGVRVVVDLTDNAVLHKSYDDDLAALLAKELSNITSALLDRLLGVDAITPQGILTFRPPFGG
ncbi:DUF4157 domain-containing protein [Saccharopolyspora sp. NPDC050642]|uniref:eCIS core domain-containing protein n=1 Tax=Saccharopolyspora sp. NPDC050642 TaxID=3157099 RepID=UPI0034099DF0